MLYKKKVTGQTDVLHVGGRLDIEPTVHRAVAATHYARARMRTTELHGLACWADADVRVPCFAGCPSREVSNGLSPIFFNF